jgi:hypothetical protein
MCYQFEADAFGVTIQEEALFPFVHDAEQLFKEHCVAVGEPEDQWRQKNLPMIGLLSRMGLWHIVTARINGRVFGYLMTIIGPSLENINTLVGTQNLYFVSKDAHSGMRLGMKLQKASIAALKARGVSEIIMRAGVRGTGSRQGVLFKRLGAEPFGQLYKLEI